MAVDINQLYQANLGRAPDPEGLAYWTGLANSGMSADDLKNAFYAGAAKEIQRDDSGLSASMDAWDEKRIADSMRNYDYIDDKTGITFWQNAGDTRTMTAAERLNALPGTYFDRTAATDAAAAAAGIAPPAPRPVTQTPGQTTTAPKKNPGLSTAQQALLKALLDQQERDGITDEMRTNASELYDRTQTYEQDALRDIGLLTGGNSGIYNRYQADIENDVGNAVADARMGQTSALNTAARQAMRYGVNVPTALAGVGTAQASQLASAANSTRNNAINNYRNLVGQGIGLKEGTFRTSQAATADSMGRAEAASMGNRNMRIQDESLDWAKQLDVTGMARGMPGASQGAYGVAVGAGNSAVQNQMAPGQALIGAMGQANNTTMQGQQLALGGLGNILNAQTSYAGTVAKSNSDRFGASMDMLGTGLGLAFSDARLKRNVVRLADDPRGFGWYEFEYLWGGGRQVGVMAQEVERIIPGVVVEVAGYKAVDYGRL